MKFLDNIKLIQIDPNNLSGKFLKVREYFFTKNKISVFANKLFIYTLSLLMCCCVCAGRLSNVPASMIPDQFGMAGLVNLIRSAQSDQSMMTLVPGIDLTTLGLNMTYPE